VHPAGGSAKGALGSEGLLSFRGAPLEPQRFTPQCGLEGPHVPGKRWQKRVQVLHPLMVESYGTEVNAEQLICVSVENVLPPVGSTADVVLFVDSISLEWRSGAAGGGPLPVHIACVEVRSWGGAGKYAIACCAVNVPAEFQRLINADYNQHRLM
jgi:hypothetical protein